jgi:hypothetical protein
LLAESEDFKGGIASHAEEKRRMQRMRIVNKN